MVSLVPGAGNILAAVGKVLVKRAEKRVGQETGNLQKNKDRIVNKLMEEKLEIIASIDDIDRLSEEEIIAVFQLVKALGDFLNIIYILAFDYDVMIRVLGKIQHGDGKEYLEKVTQVPFEISAPSMENIHSAFFSKLSAVLGDIREERWDKTTWAELFQFGLKKYIRSIRDVIRFTSVFSLRYELLKDEIDPVDVPGLTCLQVFEPPVYSKLPSYKDILCGTSYSYSHEQQKEEEEKTKKIVSSLLSNKGIVANLEIVNDILGILFPRIKMAVGILYGIGRDYARRDYLINNKTAIPECSDRYFALVLKTDATSIAMTKRLIYESDETDLSEGTMQLYQDGKIIRLLEEIKAYANSSGSSTTIFVERASLIIRELARKRGHFEVDDSGFFSMPFAWRLPFCIGPSLKVMDSTTRFSCVYSIFEDKGIQPSTLVLLLNDFETQHGRYTEKTVSGDDAMFSLEKVLKLEQTFKIRAIEALDSGDALRQYQGLNFLWMLGQIDAELVANKKKSIITDNVSLIRIISYCISRGAVIARTGLKTYDANQNAVEEFIDVDEAYRRVKAFAVTSQFYLLPKDGQIDVIAFILIIERTGSEFILEDGIVEDFVIRVLD